MSFRLTAPVLLTILLIGTAVPVCAETNGAADRKPLFAFSQRLWEIVRHDGECAFHAGDVDGDGVDELLCIAVPAEAGSSTSLRLDLYRSNRRDGFAPPERSAFPEAADAALTSAAVGDLDNDGREELLLLAESYKTLYSIYFTPDGPQLIAANLGRGFGPSRLVVLPRAGENGSSLLVIAPLRVPSRARAGFTVLVHASRKDHFEVRSHFVTIDQNYPHQALRMPKQGAYQLATERVEGGKCLITAGPHLQVWAEAPCRAGTTPQILYGDFNGDQLEDALIAGARPEGTWSVISTPNYVLELPAPIELSPGTERVTAELTGDGLSDIFEPASKLLYVAETRSPETPPAENAAVNVYGGPGKGPYVCNGYLPDALGTKWGRAYFYCPKSYVAIEVDDNPEGPLSCCRLPRDDVLTEDEELVPVDSRCPQNTVVTGFVKEPVSTDQTRVTHLRCTRLNESRYLLGAARDALYWGVGRSAPENRMQLSREALPPAARFGIGRMGYDRWDIDGCVGDPPGSVLVSGLSRNCTGVRFAPILEKQGKALVPLQIFPDCAAPPPGFVPDAGCTVVVPQAR